MIFTKIRVFVNLAGLDFRLRPDSAVFKKIPGFKAPDFAKMGLYDDPARATPAVKFGPGVTFMSPIMSPEVLEKAKLPILADVPPAGSDIIIDGEIGPAEWPAAENGALPPIKWDMDGKEVSLGSSVRLMADGTCIYIAVENDITAKRRATRGHKWGRDDGVELALSVARSARLPNKVDAFVFRGYADGHVESVTVGGMNEADAARAIKGVAYAANRSRKGSWAAEWKIPFASIGFAPGDGNFPFMTHITVRKPAEDIWANWRKRWSRTTWDVKGAYALCLESLGTVAFIPGQRLSHVRIDVQGDRKATALSMNPGPGTNAPEWAKKWNRLVGSAGTVYADKWQEYKMEFTPCADTIVSLELMGTQTRPPVADVWTYYDDFHVNGAELINGDFEEIGKDGKAAGWNCPKASGDKAGFVKLGKGAASGSYAVITSHDKRANQRIKITKDRKVTITFKAKAVLPDVRPVEN